jgi:hypothetical protein
MRYAFGVVEARDARSGQLANAVERQAVRTFATVHSSVDIVLDQSHDSKRTRDDNGTARSLRNIALMSLVTRILKPICFHLI